MRSKAGADAKINQGLVVMAAPTTSAEYVEHLSTLLTQIGAGAQHRMMYHAALTNLVALAKAEQAAEPHRDFLQCMGIKLPEQN